MFRPASACTVSAFFALLTLPIAHAQSDASTKAFSLAPVVVTATRTEAAPFDVPASIDRIDGDGLREARLQVNLSEGLASVPGLAIRNRQNYAQDEQISVRGFGARSSFGIRGVRLYVDGIPATLPDGQGQISNVDLGSVERIEVLRGPFSALYGNSSGGVIQVFSEEGSGPPAWTTSLTGGSNGALRLGTKVSGAEGPLSYLASVSRFSTDGYRDHSAAERQLGNAKLTWQPDAASRLTLVANSVALPKAEDPLGLTHAQLDANPRSADPSATAFNTRKTVDQTQAGTVYERRFDASQSLRALFYFGHRNTEQFQAIPVAAQANPLHPGGVIALGRDYSGFDGRWTTKTSLNGAPLTWIAGLAYDSLQEQRLGYQNFIGASTGEPGALRRNETNRVANFDQYLQGDWQWAPRWHLHAGLRHSQVRFTSSDHYIVGGNPDDSGAVNYSATLPVVGLLFALTPDMHLYANGGSGFETPTLNELAYRPNGASGLNFSLRPARSRNAEAGIKIRDPSWGNFNLAGFVTRTRDEIVTLANVDGRSTYQNAGATQRHGIEADWSQRLAEDLRAEASYNWLNARYRDAFQTCSATPCAAPNQAVAAGNRIPGVARESFHAALTWAPWQGWRAGVEGQVLSRVAVNDVNNDQAPGYATANLHGGYVAHVGAWELATFGRIDNLFARAYAGSVIVNESNGRYFEPAPGRTWGLGLTATVRSR